MNKSEISPRHLDGSSKDAVPNKYKKKLLEIANLPPIAGVLSIPNIQEGNIFTSLEWNVLRGALTALAVGGILISEAARRRQMEPAATKDRNLSKIGMGLKTVGVSGFLYVLWNLDKI